MSETAKLVRVTGLVQGVGFRAYVQARALDFGIDGWVRNESDGSVTAFVRGDKAQVQRMLESLREGPRGSMVSEVSAEDAEPEATRGFEIRR
jgi:acylphosphatase